MTSRILVASATLALVACGSRTPTQTVPETVASIAVSPGRDTVVALGQTRQFTATAKNSSGVAITGKTFVWQSSAPGVVGVDPATGVATAIGRGEATITAAVDGKTGTASLTVIQQVSTVDVSPGSASLATIGGNQQFTAVAKDANGAVVSGVTFLWISSDPAVATVDNSGKVTARAPGVTTIIAAGLGVPGSATFTVTQTATQLAIAVAPTGATEGLGFPGTVQIEIRDANGALVTSARNSVTLAIGTNPGSGVLGGATTVNAIGGIATFSGLSISSAGTGYTLTATATGLTSVSTAAFNVFLNFVGVGAGGSTTCGLTASGAVYCWGSNGNGQLGDGTTTSRSLPTKVIAPAGVRFAQISQNAKDVTALVTNCARSDGGAGYCWGAGATGGIGDGQTVNRLTATLVTSPLGDPFTSISAGSTHACGISPNGSAYCWGNGVRGNLGDGTGNNRTLPTLVIPPVGVTFATISAGFGYTCGTTATGTAYCWGLGTNSNIGDGFAVDRFSPTLVAAPGGTTFATVQAGGAVSCGLTFISTIYCWGLGISGQLGDGTLATRGTPGLITTPGGVTWSSLSTGVGHECALSTAGLAYCWGSNGTAELGDGSTTDRSVPTAVSMPAGITFVAISTGAQHTCGITASGAMYCWGLNNSGQLGDGSTASRTTPVRVQR